MNCKTSRIEVSIGREGFIESMLFELARKGIDLSVEIIHGNFFLKKLFLKAVFLKIFFSGIFFRDF